MAITLDLNEEERATLVGVLESYVSDLRMEIADTDRMAFREMLKARKAVIMKTLDSLRAAATAAEAD